MTTMTIAAPHSLSIPDDPVPQPQPLRDIAREPGVTPVLAVAPIGKCSDGL
ncbi:hypothetical protein [Pseudomonas fluorescens]|uniref:Uncharacterized protein n=1 Tax=Pseudomonas fluorescens TaxID=294 RepID=A0A5E7CYM4_PSEFL|nr:hypothetical protein [Pseudomonas fluorescens]VVO04795.1 hypothetical protein PS691_02915 [Pseudomonas fluorescens]